jgi:ADP-ribose pyrophosphatase YjhB (NUDIX family)
MGYPVQSLISIIGDTPQWDVEYCVDMLITMEDEWLVYINRLSEPLGHAMPGGRIEPGESAAVAAMREGTEEIGCPVTNLEYLATLADSGRDPRGHKVSIVLKASTTKQDFFGEEGKTQVVYSPLSNIPPPEVFAFDHGPFVHSQIAK